jgi:hypothetical protein
LSTLLNEQLPDGSFNLPQIGRLTNKGGAVTEGGKEVLVVTVKILKEVFIRLEFEVSTTDFHRDDFFIRECWRKSTSSDSIVFFHSFVSCDYQTIHSNDKTVSVH